MNGMIRTGVTMTLLSPEGAHTYDRCTLQPVAHAETLVLLLIIFIHVVN